MGRFERVAWHDVLQPGTLTRHRTFAQRNGEGVRHADRPCCYYASSIRFRTYPYSSFHLDQHFPTTANRHHGWEPGFILFALLCLIAAVASHLKSSF